MNHLAHFHLAGDDLQVCVGSFLGDFVKGRFAGLYPSGIERGIDLHRKVDAFTDAHATVAEGKRRVAASRRRYAGILLDVFFDHFLSKHWSDYASEPLGEFTRRMYAALIEHESVLPPLVKTGLPAMIERDWLMSCGEVAGVDATLRRISRRLTRPNPLGEGVEDLIAHYEAFEIDFRTFFPRLTDFARIVSLSGKG